MDRKVYKGQMRHSFMPNWTCPTCEIGLLKQKKDSFFSSEIANSRDHSHDAWEPEWMNYVFSCQLICNNENCKEVVICSGEGEVELDFGYDEEITTSEAWSDVFTPNFFQPPLKLFRIPAKTPNSVAEPLKESFKLFFSSPGAAANCVRISIECLLTELKVKRFDRVNGKLNYITLHRRINLLPSKYTGVKDMLMAIKWLGNAGSHDGNTITPDDVLDSYEFMEHVLNEIYASKSKELAARARKVNKSKGPAKSAKRKRSTLIF